MKPATIEDLRYIVFLLDSKIKEHDGQVFCSLQDAKDYIENTLDGTYADKAVIGVFVFDVNAKMMGISHINSIGFKGDKKSINKLELFK